MLISNTGHVKLADFGTCVKLNPVSNYDLVYVYGISISFRRERSSVPPQQVGDAP